MHAIAAGVGYMYEPAVLQYFGLIGIVDKVLPTVELLLMVNKSNSPGLEARLGRCISVESMPPPRT